CCDRFSPIILVASFNNVKSGSSKSVIGVGTATIICVHSCNLYGFDTYSSFLFSNCSVDNSPFGSIPLDNWFILFLFVSIPITLNFSPNAIATRSPTYPSPATPTTRKPTASNESVRIGCFFLSIVIFLSNSNIYFYINSSISKLHTNSNERQNLLSTNNV